VTSSTAAAGERTAVPASTLAARDGAVQPARPDRPVTSWALPATRWAARTQALEPPERKPATERPTSAATLPAQAVRTPSCCRDPNFPCCRWDQAPERPGARGRRPARAEEHRLRSPDRCRQPARPRPGAAPSGGRPGPSNCRWVQAGSRRESRRRPDLDPGLGPTRSRSRFRSHGLREVGSERPGCPRHLRSPKRGWRTAHRWRPRVASLVVERPNLGWPTRTLLPTAPSPPQAKQHRTAVPRAGATRHASPATDGPMASLKLFPTHSTHVLSAERLRKFSPLAPQAVLRRSVNAQRHDRFRSFTALFGTTPETLRSQSVNIAFAAGVGQNERASRLVLLTFALTRVAPLFWRRASVARDRFAAAIPPSARVDRCRLAGLGSLGPRTWLKRIPHLIGDGNASIGDGLAAIANSSMVAPALTNVTVSRLRASNAIRPNGNSEIELRIGPTSEERRSNTVVCPALATIR
jgi:hypothetical protein